MARPGLFRHLTRQRFDRTAAAHHVSVLAEPSFFAQDVLDVSCPALGAHRLLGRPTPLKHLAKIVAPYFQPVDASQHRGVGRNGVAEQCIAPALGMEAQGRGLAFKPNHCAVRHVHRGEQPRPKRARRTGHRHA